MVKPFFGNTPTFYLNMIRKKHIKYTGIAIIDKFGTLYETNIEFFNILKLDIDKKEYYNNITNIFPYFLETFQNYIKT